MDKNSEFAMLAYILDKTGDVIRYLKDMETYLNSAENTLDKRIKKDNVLTGEEIRNLNSLFSECMKLNEIIETRLSACQLINTID